MRQSSILTTPVQGYCYVYLAFLAGSEIDLDLASKLTSDASERVGLKRNRRAPRHLDFEPLPLQISLADSKLKISSISAEFDPTVEITFFDFGAVSVEYKIPLSTTLPNLTGLNVEIYDNEELHRDAENKVTGLLKEIAGAISNRASLDVCEMYTVFDFVPFSESEPMNELLSSIEHQLVFAQILRAVDEPMSAERMREATRLSIAYGLHDAAYVDWSTAILIGSDTQDERAVLEFANVELLELRVLDQRLDQHLEHAYDVQSGKISLSLRSALRLVSRLQIDSAMLYESVDNALKLVGDQYLADVYRLISERYDLSVWHQSIRRKIEALDSIYQQLSDRAQHRRSEILEITIIALIAFEIVFSLAEKFWF